MHALHPHAPQMHPTLGARLGHVRQPSPIQQSRRQPSSRRFLAVQATQSNADSYLEEPPTKVASFEERLSKAMLPQWRKLLEEQYQKSGNKDPPGTDGGSGGNGGSRNGGEGGGGGGGGNGGNGDEEQPSRPSFRVGEWYWWSGSFFDALCWMVGTMAVWVAAGVAQVEEDSKLGNRMEPLAAAR